MLMKIRSREMLRLRGALVVDIFDRLVVEGHPKVWIPASHWHLSKKRDVSYLLALAKALLGAVDLAMEAG